MHDVLADLTDEEYQWEPLPVSERRADMALPPDMKRVWRVYQRGQLWTYDYAGGRLIPPPFTTIAWLTNHVVSTADMYWYCIRSGQPVGKTRDWGDIVVPPTRQAMSDSLAAVFSQIRASLQDLPPEQIDPELNRPAPAPWGEQRPTVLNIWGGIIEHAIEHAAQIAARKERMRYDY